MKDDPIVIIAGPTATGKTRVAIELAKNLDNEAEIINSDSVQLYKDLKILTAFPSESDLKKLPHHLFGILNADEKFSVTSWKNSAEKKIDEIHNKKKIPIICGGTGFYINSIINGISEIPEIPASYRKTVQEKFALMGREKFFEELCKMDKEIQFNLHPNNTQRILRAYEVVSFTKKPLSFWWKSKNEKPKYSNIKSFIIIPEKKSDHNELILNRINEMINNGAIDEVDDFLKIYPEYDGPLTKVIGFYEIKSFLQNKISEEQLIEHMFIKTRQYAKRQSTWFRNKMENAIFIKSADDILKYF